MCDGAITVRTVKTAIQGNFKDLMSKMFSQVVIPCMISFVVRCIYKRVCLIQISNLLNKIKRNIYYTTFSQLGLFLKNKRILYT
ncbi:hypothetical protein SRABI80_03436 [Peribacillus frigoritolerans]|nr:hypothetical protein SRABI80_03436 [Peribacillus frigoritolerans]